MRRYRSSLIAAMLACCATSCAFDDGKPWGRALFAVSATFEPPAGRLDDGALITSSDFRIDLAEVELTLASVQLGVSSGGTAAAFDPANPPPGYGLCHNGHCHADSGELVDYEDIVVAGADEAVVTQALQGALSLTTQPVDATLGECDDGCRIPRGALTSVRLHATELRLRGVVHDPLDRLDEPLPIDLNVPLDLEISRGVTGAVGPREPGLIELNLALAVPPHLLDGVDFSTSDDLATEVAQHFSEHLRLDVDVAASDL